jgi:hypothetical protein
MSQIIQQQQYKVFLKTFLIDSVVANNGMRVNGGYINRHINKFVGKPVILTPEKDHPLEFRSYIQTGNPDIDIPELMKPQDKYRIGKIISVDPMDNVQQGSSNGQPIYSAIIEIDTVRGKSLYRDNRLPKFVSPSIYIVGGSYDNIKDYSPLHLAMVRSPAYGTDKANVKKSCEDIETNCVSKLAQASLLDKVNRDKMLLERLFSFSGIDGKNTPIPFWHEDIYHNSNRVAQVGSGQKKNNTKPYKQRLQMIAKLNRILRLTYSTRG